MPLTSSMIPIRRCICNGERPTCTRLPRNEPECNQRQGSEDREQQFCMEQKTGDQKHDNAQAAFDEKQATEGRTQLTFVVQTVVEVDHIRWSAGAEQCADGAARKPGRNGPAARDRACAMQVEHTACAEQQHKDAKCGEQRRFRQADQQGGAGQHAEYAEWQEWLYFIPARVFAGVRAERQGRQEIRHQDQRHHEGERQEMRQQWYRNQPRAESGDAADEIRHQHDQPGGEQYFRLNNLPPD